MTTISILNITLLLMLIILHESEFAQVGDLCQIQATGQRGRCTKSFDCPIVQQQAQNGIPPTICGHLGLQIPIVCCELGSQQPQSPITTFGDFTFPENNPQPARPSTSSSSGRQRISERKCQEYTPTVTTSVLPLLIDTPETSITKEKCSKNEVPLIAGGSPAKTKEFPFIAALLYSSSSDWRCAGTLISNRWVVTAAHCTYRETPSIVRLGALDLRDHIGTNHRDYGIDKIIKHPEYRPSKKYHDISLIQLDENVAFNDYIRPACLQTTYDLNKSKAIAAGWGRLSADTNQSSKLLKVEISIYDSNRCRQFYQKYLTQGTSSIICAGDEGGKKDTCQGDSGGPLVITKESHCKYYLIGITSYGKACPSTTPAVYTRVSEYVSWIEEKVWP